MVFSKYAKKTNLDSFDLKKDKGIKGYILKAIKDITFILASAIISQHIVIGYLADN